MSAMTQQVNLLIDDLRPRRAILTALQALTGVGIVAVLLAAMSTYQWWGISVAAGQRDALTRQLATLADANAKARASINLVEDSKLAAAVAELRAQLQSRALLTAALGGSTSARSGGFAEHLDELAASIQPGLWLTDVELTGGGSRIRLAGMTTDPVLVPRFLKSLGGGTQFVGHHFDAFELAAGDTGALQFTITGPDPEVP